MQRQCAWCLCLINSMGERLSSSPLPKLYEASHGICSVCGTLWLAQAIEAKNLQNSIGIARENSHKGSMIEESVEREKQVSEEATAPFSLQLQSPLVIPKAGRQTMPL